MRRLTTLSTVHFKRTLSMRFVILSLAIGLSPLAVHAQDLAACLGVPNDQARLICYDALAGYKAAPAPDQEDDRPVSAAVSKWLFVEKTDPFSGKETSYVVLESDKANARMTDAPVSTFVRCDGKGGHEIFVVSGGYIGSTRDTVPVRYKFGENEPISEKWGESTSGKAAFLPDRFRDFRAGLLTGESFVFEFTDFRGTRSNARFPETPLSEKFDHVIGGCQAG
ncbi:hypothetical protein KUV73_23890 [Mameliella alba]|nr:hypothetical protein [Mameliella alba]MBY6172417.1 hypothetical protein [Mameliella alba]MBY6177431.1 hypothetical protein [Mameliella alba]